jgi:uncharacterized membrane protein
MESVLQLAAVTCTVLGLVSAAAVLLRARDVRLTIGVLLDFLLAAGLLRLSGDPTPRAIVTAALIILIRKVVSFGLVQHLRAGDRPGPPPPRARRLHAH